MVADSFGLTVSLTLVFLAFCVLMAGVLAFCLRERRKIDGFGNPSAHHKLPVTVDRSSSVNLLDGNFSNASPASPNSEEDEAADKRVTIVLFGSIIGGALLALMTGYLVFFRSW